MCGGAGERATCSRGGPAWCIGHDGESASHLSALKLRTAKSFSDTKPVREATNDQHLAFDSSDNAPGPGEAHVYRVSATQDGAVFGGYTIVVLG